MFKDKKNYDEVYQGLKFLHNILSKNEYGPPLFFYFASKYECTGLIARSLGSKLSPAQYYEALSFVLKEKIPDKMRDLKTLSRLLCYRKLICNIKPSTLSPVHYAIIKDHLLMLRLLKECGEDINQPYPDDYRYPGTTGLHVAARLARVEIVDYLIEEGCSIDPQDKYGITPLMIVADVYNKPGLSQAENDRLITIVHRLLQHKAGPNIASSEGFTALHYAAITGSRALLEKMIAAGGDINVRANKPLEKCYRSTLLYVASYFHKIDLVKFLLEHPDHKIDINAQGSGGLTPLNCIFDRKVGSVTEDQLYELLDLLLQHGADPNVAGSKEERPLLDAARYGYTKCVERLLKEGVSVNQKKRNGVNALFSAIFSANSTTVNYLLKQPGIQVNCRLQGGETPLQGACCCGVDTSILEALIKAGADPCAVNNYNMTGMHHLAKYKKPDHLIPVMLKYLDIDVRESSQRTPLHIACSEGNDHMAAAFIQNGADINAQDMYGRTPLFLASQYGHIAVVELLKNRSANKKIKDKYGVTAFEIAQEMGHDSIVTLLTPTAQQKKHQKKKRQRACDREKQQRKAEAKKGARKQKQTESDSEEPEQMTEQHFNGQACEIMPISSSLEFASASSVSASSSSSSAGPITKEPLWQKVDDVGKLFTTSTLADFPAYTALRQSDQNMTLVIYKNFQNAFKVVVKYDDRNAQKPDKFHAFSSAVDRYLDAGLMINQENKHEFADIMQDHNIYLKDVDHYAIILPGKIAPKYYNHRDAVDGRDKVSKMEHNGYFVYIFNKDDHCYHRCFHASSASRLLNSSYGF